MVCSIADNRPLKKLEKELNVAPRCHGKRRECILGFETQDGDFVMGLPRPNPRWLLAAIIGAVFVLVGAVSAIAFLR